MRLSWLISFLAVTACAADGGDVSKVQGALATDSRPDGETALEGVRFASIAQHFDALPTHERGSSRSSCYCFPNGDTCEFPGLKRQTHPARFGCPADEVCIGALASYGSEPGGPAGLCHKPCAHPKARVSRELESGARGLPLANCVRGEQCALLTVKGPPHDTVVAEVGACVPIPAQSDPVEIIWR